MKTLLAILFGLTGLSAFGVTLECYGLHNTQRLFTQKVDIHARSEVVLPKLNYIQSKVKSMGNNQFEIEIFNPAIPSRSYSTAVLKTPGDFVKWANWDRDAIFEIACVQR